ELGFGFLDARDVRKCYPGLLLDIDLGARLADAHHAPEPLLLGEVAEEEGPDPEEDESRHDPRQEGADEGAVSRAPELDVVFREVRSELRFDALCYEIDLAVLERRFEFTLDPVLMNEYFLDLAVFEIGLELAVRDRLVGRCRRDKLE